MESSAQTPRQFAEALYALMPRALSPAILAEFGIVATAQQAQHITREVLMVNLFWIHTALEALLTARGLERVLQELERIIRAVWTSEFQLDPQELEGHGAHLDTRRRAYESVTRQGGDPIAVFAETASLLESSRVVLPEDRNKILALLIDLVPVESYGDLAEDVELTDA